MNALRHGCLCLMTIVLVGLAPAFVHGQQEKTLTRENTASFLRIKQDRKGEPSAMQIAIVRYTSPKGNADYSVDLVGVVHIGDESYYDQLNDRFEHYDAVLYELVAPQKGMIPRRDQSSDNPLAVVLKMATRLFGWKSQLDCIDYTPKNFVHADLTYAEMAEILRKRGDDAFTIGLSAVADYLRQQNLQQQHAAKAAPDPGPDLGELWSDPKALSKIKRVLADQMTKAGDGSGFGPTLDTILITDRNAACMKVLSEQIKAGKKRIAIFYGAAHMPDFEKRLKREYGMERQQTEWLTAWDLRLRSIDLIDILEVFFRED